VYDDTPAFGSAQPVGRPRLGQSMRRALTNETKIPIFYSKEFIFLLLVETLIVRCRRLAAVIRAGTLHGAHPS